MIILSVTAVPFFHRAKVYTAYEYLERRFDVRTRSLGEPAVHAGAGRRARRHAGGAGRSSSRRSLGWRLPATVLVICVPMIVYTSIGGVQAVAWADVKQMFIHRRRHDGGVPIGKGAWNAYGESMRGIRWSPRQSLAFRFHAGFRSNSRMKDRRRSCADDDRHLFDVGPGHRLHAADARVDDHRDADHQHRSREGASRGSPR